jgi:peptide/nickel transport system permease protein
MLQYIARRLLHAIPVILLSSIVIFALLHLAPGDPALILAGPDADADTVQAVRQRMGLDQPLYVQYGIWIGQMLRGDMGRSYVNNRPVRELIMQRIPATLQLALAGLLIALTVGGITGVMAALNRRKAVDWVVSSINAFAVAIPNFWFGILVILFFAVTLRWLPPGGRGSFTDDPGRALQFLALPALTLAINQMAVLSRFIRSSVLDVLTDDYVRTAHAKGLRSRVVILRHVLPNAFMPVVTVLGIQIGGLVGGAVVIETVFAWPGVGRLLLQSVQSRDYTVVQGVLLLLVTSFILVNLLTDIMYGVLDPRVRVDK